MDERRGFEYQPTLKAMFKDDSTNVLHGWRKLYKNIEGDSSSPQFPLRLVFGGNNHVVPGTVDINSIPVEDTQPDHHYIIVLKSLNTPGDISPNVQKDFQFTEKFVVETIKFGIPIGIFSWVIILFLEKLIIEWIESKHTLSSH